MKYLKLIRVKHWIKNGLVFLPLFFSGCLFEIDLLIKAILAFFIFSLTSSVVYVNNDISDVEKDKKHPIKKKRPLASGIISIKTARIIEVVLLLIDIVMIGILWYMGMHSVGVFIIPFVYLILNIFYSKGLKNVPIVDVVILVSGFVFRVMYGGVVTAVEVSKYLYLMIIFGSFYLGFGKRRNEIIKNSTNSRKVLKLYNKDFLDKNMYVCLGLAIISYALWCLDPSTIMRIGNDYIFWTIPLVMIIFQLYSLDIEKDSHGDPIEIVLSNKKLLITIIIYILIIGGILYLL